MSARQEFCVQYRCPPGMTDWCEYAGTTRHELKWAQVELNNLLSTEWDETVEYRIAVRTVTDWAALA